METLYNRDKIPPAEPSLKGNIVPDAKRTENFTPLPWRTLPDLLCGDLSCSSSLQRTAIKIVFAKTGLYFAMFQLLSSCPGNLARSLCLDSCDPPSKNGGIYDVWKNEPLNFLTTLLIVLGIDSRNMQCSNDFLIRRTIIRTFFRYS